MIIGSDVIYQSAQAAEDMFQAMEILQGKINLTGLHYICLLYTSWKDRGDWVTYEDQTLGKEVTAFGFAPKMSETPGKVWRGAPRLGQDTEAVMKKLLGYSQEEIDAFKGRGIID